MRANCAVMEVTRKWDSTQLSYFSLRNQADTWSILLLNFESHVFEDTFAPEAETFLAGIVLSGLQMRNGVRSS